MIDASGNRKEINAESHRPAAESKEAGKHRAA